MNDNEDSDSSKENQDPNIPKRRCSKRLKKSPSLCDSQATPSNPSLPSTSNSAKDNSFDYKPLNIVPSSIVSNEGTPIYFHPNINRPPSHSDNYAPYIYPSSPVQPPVPRSSAPYTNGVHLSASLGTSNDNRQAAHAAEDDDHTAHAAGDDDQATRSADDNHQAAHTVEHDDHSAHSADDDHQDISAPLTVAQGAEPTSDFIPHGTSDSCSISIQPIVSDPPVINSKYRSPVIGPDQARDDTFMDQNMKVMQVLQRCLGSMGRTLDRVEMDWRAARRQDSSYESYLYNRLSGIHHEINISTKSYIILFEEYLAKKEIEK